MTLLPPRNALNTDATAYMGNVLRAALRDADEVHICVSFLRFSGLNLMVDDLRKFVARGGSLKLLVSTYLNVTQPQALEAVTRLGALADEDPTQVQVRLQHGAQGFHTKYYMFGRRGAERRCWVGSSNFTKNGLYSSVEWNTAHDDAARVDACERLFGGLWDRSDVQPVTLEVISEYAARFEAANRLLQSAPVVSPGVPQPNAAQREALRSLHELRRRGVTRAAVIAATGLGKTHLAAFDVAASAWARPQGVAAPQRVLFVAHREELLLQAQKTFAQVHPQRTSGLLASGQRPGDVDFVFATIQSASRQSMTGQLFDYVVIDEFHHAQAASYRTLLDSVQFGFLLGLTATPERLDGQDVLDLCDHNVAYEVRLPEAIDQGWLIPFHYFGIADDVDYGQVRWRGGQFDPEALETALMLEERTELILRHALEKGYDGVRRATVGFCAGVRHARYMAESFLARGHVAASVTGELSPTERRAIYARFEDPADPLEWLFVADLLNEGVDLPVINSLLFLRPTQSTGLFLQQLGRGLRHHPQTEILTVLDFVGHHRNALVPLEALSSAALQTVPGRMLSDLLPYSPPRLCEIILEDQTERILLKVQRELPNRTAPAAHREAYERVRAELGRPPELMAFWGHPDRPSFPELRRSFGSWIGVRAKMGDADVWEKTVLDDPVVNNLLTVAESNLQLQRVAGYAVFWALVHDPHDLPRGVSAFYQRYPQWTAEPTEKVDAALATLEKALVKKQGKYLGWLAGGQLAPALVARLDADPRLAAEVSKRLEYTLATEYQTRHGGVLRSPAELVRYVGYRRHQVVNHFGEQFDPARHNTGVLRLGSAFALLTQLDTSGGKLEYHYRNGLTPDMAHFMWSSQNKQRPDRGDGQDIVEHRRRGVALHLFVEQKTSGLYVYLGEVNVVDVSGSQPFTARLALPEVLPDEVQRQLGL